jgi:ABC-type Fe3+-siderophore transport system permease subunit
VIPRFAPSGGRRAAFALAIVLPLVAGCAALAVGPGGVGLRDLLDAAGGGGSETVRDVLFTWRLPRVLLGLAVGGSLALAGVVLQALLRNDLAEPYLVGVGPGAYLGVTVAALVAGGGALPGAATRGVFALGGAVGVSLVVFSAARRTGRLAGPTLLLAGVALGAFVSALATAALYAAVPEWQHVVTWLLGDLGQGGWPEVAVGGAALAAGFLVVLWRARDLDAVALGEESAWLVGVETRRLLLGLGLAACVLAAASVAVAGLVGFVGLLVPHLARRAVGAGHRLLVPASVGLGAALLVAADALARTLMPPLELPVGVVTAALGAPVLAWILLRRGR